MSRADRIATARNARVFGEARRRLELEIRAITHRNAAKGLLKSGGTIKEIVRAFDESTLVGLTDALDGVAVVSPQPGAKRKRLLEQLQASLAHQHREGARIARQAIERIGLGNDFKHAVPLIDQAVARHRDKITDFGEGWTAPAVKPWKEQHPYVYDGLLLLLGWALGFASQPLVNLIFRSQDKAEISAKRSVAPDVAPAQAPAPAAGSESQLSY